MPVGRIETIIVALPIAAVLGVVGWSIHSARQDMAEKTQTAIEQGFSDAADMEAARRAGLTDVAAWRVRQQQDKKKEADAAAERERIKAADQAAAAAYEAARPAREALAAKKAKEEYDSHHITRPLVTIVNWEKGGFGSVALVTVKITNTSDKGYIKDVAVECKYSGKSGTTINRHTAVVYETIKPKQSYVAKALNMGFVDQQTVGASCDYIGASAPYGMTIE